ncbi:TIR domain-containing protein [Frisingicoccus sp.]|uniref:TIR domain-containing protein n=1 Tax=Frisingicoccus sp. TaxID=1918627 RepID=UPI0015B832B5
MIFISYGHDEHENLIRKIAEDLRKDNIEVWIDYDCLYGSSQWEQKIETGIQASNWVIVFMTNYSMRRPDGYCLDEISFARFHNKQIMPIKIQNVPPPISIARIQWLDMSEYAAEDGQIDEAYYKKKKEELIEILSGLKEMDYYVDANYLLLNHLKPLDNESYLVQNKKFYGREWLFKEYECWIKNAEKSRVFAIVGQAGSGKTAFVSKLCHTSGNVAAIHFCRYNNDERANPKRAFMSLAYHLSTQLEEYRQELLSLTDLDKLLEKSTSRLFEYLFVEPLMKIHAPDRTIVLVIDALDEATKYMKNELVDLIVRDFQKTPEWLRLVITSRPEQDILRRLGHLNPVIIVNDSENNKNDIRGYLQCYLEPFMQDSNLKMQQEIIDKVLKKSEGSFLYAAEIVKAVELGTFNLKDVDNFPVGLTNIYLSYFERMFIKDTTYDYKKDIRPIMEILAVCYEPQTDDTIIEMLNLDEYDFEDIKNYIYVLFPSERGCIEPLHKSLIDWIVDRNLSGNFFVNEKAAHTRMVNYYYEIFSAGKDNEYVTKYLAKHMLKSKRPEDAVEILTSMDIQKTRIRLIGQDSAIREYLTENQMLKEYNMLLATDVLRSDTFKYIFVENRRYFYNAGLYFELKDLGFDEVIEEYKQIDSLEILAGCVNYYYINEQYEKSENLACDIVKRYNIPENYSIITEIENEIALSCRKLVRFDDALQRCKIICEVTGASCHDFYEVALAHQTIGKVYYHRCQWKEAYKELCTAVRLLEDSLLMTGDADYSKMLKLYVAAFEREVALSLVWQKKTELAEQHLAHAGDIYNEIKSTDRYYIRYLYVGMFADAVNGNFVKVKEIYPNLLKIAKSNYDKSQLECYYAMAMFWCHDRDAAIEHILQAENFVDKIDAVLEKHEIRLLKKMIMDENIVSEDFEVENEDIAKWLTFVQQFIIEVMEGIRE